jgi:hypothetical protein
MRGNAFQTIAWIVLLWRRSPDPHNWPSMRRFVEQLMKEA